VRFRNRNPLIAVGLADGVTTGFVQDIGYGMVASSARKGRQLIGVVLGTKTAERETEMRSLLAWGFGEPQPTLPITKTQRGSLPTVKQTATAFECRNFIPAANMVLPVPCTE